MTQNLGAKQEGETKSSGSRDKSAKEDVAGVMRIDHVRNEDIRAYAVKAGRSCGAGGQKERYLVEIGRRANWIYYRDGNEWSCTREKTKREAKKAMGRCLLTDAKM